MGQNKFETQIKEQLNAREIKPTEMAWDRLDAMLSVTEEKKTKKGFGWLSIAAVFIGFILVGFVIYQLNSTDIEIENSVVIQEHTTKVEPQLNSRSIVEPNLEIATPTTKVAVVTSIINQKTTSTREPRSNHQNNQKTILIENENSEKQQAVADHSLDTEITIETKLKIIPISVSPNVLLASVDSSKKEKSNKSSVKVNATSMLAQAEGEQNSNFRETRLQKLKRNFKTVKTAVANRNNQE